MNETLLIAKPGAPLGWMLDKVERHDFEIVQIKAVMLDTDMLDKHYQEHLGKDWYPEMRSLLVGKRAFIVHVYGYECQRILRRACKAWRAYFGLENWFHASDSEAAAKREIELWW